MLIPWVICRHWEVWIIQRCRIIFPSLKFLVPVTYIHCENFALLCHFNNHFLQLTDTFKLEVGRLLLDRRELVILIVKRIWSTCFLQNIAWLETQVTIWCRLESFTINWVWRIISYADSLLIPILTDDANITTKSACCNIRLRLLLEAVLGLRTSKHAMRGKWLWSLLCIFHLLCLFLSSHLIVTFSGTMLEWIPVYADACIKLPSVTLAILQYHWALFLWWATDISHF